MGRAYREELATTEFQETRDKLAIKDLLATLEPQVLDWMENVATVEALVRPGSQEETDLMADLVVMATRVRRAWLATAACLAAVVTPATLAHRV